PVDLRGRMRWYGLYTQRAPGIPGGRTAILEPQDLEDEYFMMRIRIDGGALLADQLAVIGEVASTYGRDLADITDRQTVEMRWISTADAPTIWTKLEAVGLPTTEACGDTPRVILGCPLAGIESDGIVERTGGSSRHSQESNGG